MWRVVLGIVGALAYAVAIFAATLWVCEYIDWIATERRDCERLCKPYQWRWVDRHGCSCMSPDGIWKREG